MDPTTAVTTNVVLALVGLAGCVVLLMLLIARWKWHVFLALLLPILLFGVLPGIQRNNFIEAFEQGFGVTLGKIGIVIVLGSIIAEALRHTGAIKVITRSMVRLVGAQRMPIALTLTGFVLGVAIFSDVAYVILNPLVHSAAHAMGVGMGTMSVGLVGALQLTHAIVPPTPGPLAATALLGADIGKTIIFGSIACLVGSLAGWVWGQFIAGPRITTQPAEEFKDQAFLEAAQDERLPSTLSSYAPIVVPVVLTDRCAGGVDQRPERGQARARRGPPPPPDPGICGLARGGVDDRTVARLSEHRPRREPD
jgi:GntP family gluconate:H+ symporter